MFIFWEIVSFFFLNMILYNLLKNCNVIQIVISHK
jgi:hypothetical protein